MTCYRMAASYTVNGVQTWLAEKLSLSNYSTSFTPTQPGKYTIWLGARSYVESDARSGQGSMTVTITVAAAPATVPVTGVALSSTSKDVCVDDSFTLAATVSPATATNKAVTWTSSNNKVATVNSSGKVTAVGVGTATITCRSISNSNAASTCTVTVLESDPFHPSNIEYIRISKYDMTQYGGDNEITTVVTKSKLNSDEYFEVYAPNKDTIAFAINTKTKNELNQLAESYKNGNPALPPSAGANYYFYLAKLGVDYLVSEGIIASGSAEYYGIWASEANRLLISAKMTMNQIQLALATVTAVYSIYSIVSTINAARMQINSTKTVYSVAYKVTADEVGELFFELSEKGVKFTRENTMWIVRRANGQISWLETGTSKSGFQHILEGHPVSQFAAFGVKTEAGLSSLIYNAVTAQTPVGTLKDGLIFSYNNNYLCVVIADNGYIVNTYNANHSINNIVFY